MSYDSRQILQTCLSDNRFLRSYEGAVAALMRLDERMLRSDEGLRRGLAARLDYHEAQALVGRSGGFIHFNDLVLFDLNTNVLVPTDDVVRARALLVKRRALQKLAATAMLEPQQLADTTGLDEADFTVDDEVDASSTWVEAEEMKEALSGIEVVLSRKKTVSTASMKQVLMSARDFPALLGAMLIFDHWRVHEGDRMTEIAPFLFGLFLNGRKFTRGHFPALARGLWRQAPKWQADLVHEERFRLLAVAIADSAIKTMGDLDKLVLAREVLRTKLAENFDRDTTLSKLIEMFVEHPLVTVELAARRLRLTPQAIEYQIKKLGTAMPREMTGRKRYRAWGI